MSVLICQCIRVCVDNMYMWIDLPTDRYPASTMGWLRLVGSLK